MHIFFCGIGGSGLSGLAHIALDLGFVVSGSDICSSQNTDELQMRGATIFLEQKDSQNIQNLNQKHKVDWFVQTAAIKNDHPELQFAKKLQELQKSLENSKLENLQKYENYDRIGNVLNHENLDTKIWKDEENLKYDQEKTKNSIIKISKRDEFINFVIDQKKLKLIAVAGTHGKTTTTGMLVWLFQKLEIPISYLVGSNITFGKSGQFQEKSEYFVLECDEFDRNFLKFHPEIAIIPSLDYDHPDSYPTESDYFEAFREFLNQVQKITYCYDCDFQKLSRPAKNEDFESFKSSEAFELKEKIGKKIFEIEKSDDYQMRKISKGINLVGKHNRMNAYLVVMCVFNLPILGEICKDKYSGWENYQFLDQIGKKTKRERNKKFQQMCDLLADFPGTARRFEKLAKNVYSDYAHHPSEIAATLNLAKELVKNME